MMRWTYGCPKCGQILYADWASRKRLWICAFCRAPSYPPDPSEDHAAFVDSREPPQEVVDLVLELRGIGCTVPGCRQRAEVLDHRIAFARGGRTSIENLYPMCEAH